MTHAIALLGDVLDKIDELMTALEELVITDKTREWRKDVEWLKNDVTNTLHYAELEVMQTRSAQLRNEAVTGIPEATESCTCWDTDKPAIGGDNVCPVHPLLS